MGNIEFLSETFGDELANCSIEKLEEMAILTDAKKSKERLDDILIVRRIKLNDEFKWTPENRKKLLHLNDKLIDCFEKLKAEAERVLPTAQNRISSKDDFMHDFGIDAVVTPYFYEEDENGKRYEKEDGIEEVLMLNWKDWMLQFSVSDVDSFNHTLYFDRKLSWNIDELNGEFDDCYISYGIHELVSHATGWSFSDVLKINHLWAELKVTYQHFTDV